MSDYRDLVEASLVPVKEFLETNPGGRYSAETTTRTVRMRFDGEFCHDGSLNMDDVWNIFVDDLADLIENGDVDATGDPILMSFDGAKKRKKEPVRVVISQAIMETRRVPAKGTTEVTLWFSFGVEWKNG